MFNLQNLGDVYNIKFSTGATVKQINLVVGFFDIYNQLIEDRLIIIETTRTGSTSKAELDITNYPSGTVFVKYIGMLTLI